MLQLLKKIRFGKLVLVLFLLTLVIMLVLASEDCPTKEEYRRMIKDATRDYLTSPTKEKLANLQDMYKIYATHDFTKCLWKKTCNDGTLYGNCSVTKPLYCDNGSLVNNCQACSCKAGFGCKADGSCALLACSDGTVYDQCSSSKPLFCENGVLIDKCGVCGCNENQACIDKYICMNKTELEEPLLLIVDADKILAEKALEVAENTPVKYPEKYGTSVQQEIGKAKQSLAQANIEAGNNEYDKAINDYKNSWQHSKKAVEFANKEKPKKK